MSKPLYGIDILRVLWQYIIINGDFLYYLLIYLMHGLWYKPINQTIQESKKLKSKKTCVQKTQIDRIGK